MDVEGMGRASSAGWLRSEPRRHDCFAKAGELKWPLLRWQHELLRPVALWRVQKTDQPRFLVTYGLSCGARRRADPDVLDLGFGFPPAVRPVSSRGAIRTWRAGSPNAAQPEL